MKRLALATVGLALVVGIILGGIAGNPFNRKASAARSVTQAREDQITMLSDFADQGPRIGYSEDYVRLNAYLGLPYPLPFLVLDPGDYPPSSTFRLEGVLWELGGAGTTTCIRLFDVTASAAVPGSEACHTSLGGGDIAVVRRRSEAFPLLTGEHEYTLESKSWPVGEVAYPAVVNTARVVVEWTGAFAVGGVAELPALAGPAGTSGMSGATYAVLAGAAAGVFAFAVLTTLYARKRWLR